jgi:hypothetical protein
MLTVLRRQEENFPGFRRLQNLMLQGSATSVGDCVFTVSDDADSTVIASTAAKDIVYQQKL